MPAMNQWGHESVMFMMMKMRQESSVYLQNKTSLKSNKRTKYKTREKTKVVDTIHTRQ